MSGRESGGPFGGLVFGRKQRNALRNGACVPPMCPLFAGSQVLVVLLVTLVRSHEHERTASRVAVGVRSASCCGARDIFDVGRTSEGIASHRR